MRKGSTEREQSSRLTDGETTNGLFQLIPKLGAGTGRKNSRRQLPPFLDLLPPDTATETELSLSRPMVTLLPNGKQLEMASAFQAKVPSVAVDRQRISDYF